MRVVANVVGADDREALDVLDFLIHNLHAYSVQRGGYADMFDALQLIVELDSLLISGGSMWRVDRTLDGGPGLARRVSPAHQAAFERAIDSNGYHADCLRKAWTSAYSRDPNPSASLAHTIKALESILAPVVLPSDKRATLGRIIGTLKNQTTQYRYHLDTESGSDGLRSITTLLEGIWTSQTDRHGTSDAGSQKEIGLGVAETALHLALAMECLVRIGGLTKVR
ncbi:MAG: hypothetical protein ACKVWV_05850 [Planctomycetota bacterium]